MADETRTLWVREYLTAEMHDDAEFARQYLDHRARRAAEMMGGVPISEPVIQEWHQIAEGETIPADACLPTVVPLTEDMVGEIIEFPRPAIGDWRAIITVKCRVGA